jgi:hypothetical protein
MNDTILGGDAGAATHFRPCLEILVFCTAPRAALAPQFIEFHRAFCDHHGQALGWYKTNVMKTAKRLAGPANDQMAQMLGDRKALASYLLGVEQHSGASAADYAMPSFQFFSEEDLSDPDDRVARHMLRICLPLDETKAPDRTVERVLGLLALIDFDSGYGGFSYYWNTGDGEAERELERVNRGWLTRYPGLAYGKPLGLFSFADLGILGVSWLSFLGKSRVAELGGIDALASALPTPIDVQAIANDRGVLIRTGTQPELGDVNRGQTLPAYHAVGKVLAPLRVPDDWIDNLLVTGMTPEESQAWYARFFGDED